MHSSPNFSQALGDETDFSRPDTIRVIEKFLVDCSEAVSKRYTRYGAIKTSYCRPHLIEWSFQVYICTLNQKYRYEGEVSSVSPSPEPRTNVKVQRKGNTSAS